MSTKVPLSSTALFFLSQSIVTKQVAVAGTKQDQKEEEAGLITRRSLAFNFAPRNSTQAVERHEDRTMDMDWEFTSVKR